MFIVVDLFGTPNCYAPLLPALFLVGAHIYRLVICMYSFIHSFIHSDHFYSASSNPLLLRRAPDTARKLCRIITPKRHRQLRVKDLPKVTTWRLEREFRHSARRQIMWRIHTHSISGGRQFNMFPSISRLFLRWRGPQSTAKLDGGMTGRALLDPPLSLVSINETVSSAITNNLEHDA